MSTPRESCNCVNEFPSTIYNPLNNHIMLLVTTKIVNAMIEGAMIEICVPSIAPATFGNSDLVLSKVAMHSVISGIVVGNLM